MELTVQKRLAASVLKCSSKRVWFDETRLSDIKEGITKQDMRGLVARGFVQIKSPQGTSRGRAKLKLNQRRKGRQRGHGSRKGRATARLASKESWINRIRLQREFLNELREKKMLNNKGYRELYMKAKGGYFRSKRHVKLYIDEHNMILKK